MCDQDFFKFLKNMFERIVVIVYCATYSMQVPFPKFSLGRRAFRVISSQTTWTGKRFIIHILSRKSHCNHIESTYIYIRSSVRVYKRKKCLKKSFIKLNHDEIRTFEAESAPEAENSNSKISVRVRFIRAHSTFKGGM